MNTALRDGIDWVGYVDWTVRDFHGYDTEQGSTYNAYLVRDEQTALIDTVKAPYADILLDNIAALADFDSIRYVICNHAEPDHAGALSRVLENLPNATLVCDAKCKAALEAHNDTSDWKFKIVETGDTLPLGKRTLKFIETPMVHWPESMFTYIPEEKLLFSMDAFGQHFATSCRFDDEIPIGDIMNEAKTYYANIVMPYGKPVQKALEAAADLDIEMIAPSHGLIWRTNPGMIIERYADWADGKVRPKVLVVYDTMWGSTATMARAILDGASRHGAETELIYIRASNLTRIATAVLDSAAIAFGSSTLNAGMLPMAGATLTYLKSLRPTGRAGIAFGSFGWGRGGPEAVDEWLKSMKFEMLGDPFKVKYKPTEEAIAECRKLGELLAQKAIELSQE